jgi:hypothetical protein
MGVVKMSERSFNVLTYQMCVIFLADACMDMSSMAYFVL